MNIGLIVLCRYNSSRLPGKILKEIAGKPLIAYILERLQLVSGADQLVVATSEESTDDPIAAYCQEHGVSLFRGNLNNVAQRFLDCARHYQLDYAIRINGDNIFTDHTAVSEMLAMKDLADYEFLTNVKDRTFPTGMSIEIVNVEAYGRAIGEFEKSDHFEHVTLFYYHHPEKVKAFYHYNEVAPEAKGMKLAVDTSDDFARAEQIILAMDSSHTNYPLKPLIELIKRLDLEDSMR